MTCEYFLQAQAKAYAEVDQELDKHPNRNSVIREAVCERCKRITAKVWYLNNQYLESVSAEGNCEVTGTENPD